jgi:hypothetical protein
MRNFQTNKNMTMFFVCFNLSERYVADDHNTFSMTRSISHGVVVRDNLSKGCPKTSLESQKDVKEKRREKGTKA